MNWINSACCTSAHFNGGQNKWALNDQNRASQGMQESAEDLHTTSDTTTVQNTNNKHTSSYGAEWYSLIPEVTNKIQVKPG